MLRPSCGPLWGRCSWLCPGACRYLLRGRGRKAVADKAFSAQCSCTPTPSSSLSSLEKHYITQTPFPSLVFPISVLEISKNAEASQPAPETQWCNRQESLSRHKVEYVTLQPNFDGNILPLYDYEGISKSTRMHPTGQYRMLTQTSFKVSLLFIFLPSGSPTPSLKLLWDSTPTPMKVADHLPTHSSK